MDKKTLKSILRVDHAGEYGATRIYAGQRYVLGGSDPTLKHMAEQEQEHLRIFNQLMIKHRVRPSILQPIWYVGGFAMGALTAALGRQSAHACTIAVESVIEDHYGKQLSDFESTSQNQEIKETILQCQADEVEHKNQAQSQGGRDAKGFNVISTIIKTIVKFSIVVAKKI